MFKSVRPVIILWLVFAVAVGAAVGLNRRGQSNLCIANYGEKVINRPIRGEMFNVANGHRTAFAFRDEAPNLVGGGPTYFLTRGTDRGESLVDLIYWNSMGDAKLLEKLASTNRGTGYWDLTAYSLTDKWIAIAWHDPRHLDDRHNMVSVFDTQGTLLRREQMPFEAARIYPWGYPSITETEFRTLQRERLYDGYFIYKGATNYYLVSLPDLVIQTVPNLLGDLPIHEIIWTAQRDKVILLADDAMQIFWANSQVSTVWRFPPHKQTSTYWNGRWALSASGRYLMLHLMEYHESTVSGLLARRFFLFDTLNQQTFAQHTEPITVYEDLPTLSPIRGSITATAIGEQFFFHLPYQIAGTRQPDESGDANTDQGERSAFIQLDPVMRQRTVLWDDILEVPFVFERTQIVRYQRDGKMVWEWVGADPRQHKIIYSAAENVRVQVEEWANNRGRWILLHWIITKEKSDQEQEYFIAMVDTETGLHLRLPQGVIPYITNQMQDYPTVFYWGQTVNRDYVERLDLKTLQTQRLIDGKEYMRLSTKQDGEVLIFWRDGSVERAEQFQADGTRLGIYPVKGVKELTHSEISPDGQFGVFYNDEQIQLGQKDKSEPMILRTKQDFLGTEGSIHNVKWSPDSSAFSFVQTNSLGRWHLVVYSRNGELLREWEPQTLAMGYYTWSTCSLTSYINRESISD